MRLAVSLGLATVACARAAPPPPPPRPPPAPETVVAVVDTAPPPPDTMGSYRRPPFLPLPLIEWGPPPPGEPHGERRRTYDLQHQVVRVRFDWTRHAVVGSTSIRLAALDTPLTTASFDAVGMRIVAVRGAAGAALDHDYDGRTLTVTLRPRLSARAPTTIVVDYEAVRPTKGVQFSDRRRIVRANGTSADTRYWVPTYDHPDDKTTWEIRITTARGERALSNGRLLASRPVANGIEWHWSLTRPASTYLMSVVAGDYVVLQDVWRGVPIGYWTYPDSVEAAWRAFGSTPRMIDRFSRLAGVSYPWDKYDQAAVPDFDEGVEGVTATIHADDRILAPAWADLHADPERVVAHELAHQWFGNLVSAGDWSHVWLHEGLATFFEAVWAEHAHGADAGALARLTAFESATVAERGARRPLVFDRWVSDPRELLFTGHAGARGAAILHMLRRTVGDSAFWNGIAAYARAHSWRTVATPDLQRAIETASGRDLERFFQQWVYGAGLPAFRVSFAYDSLRGTLVVDAQQMQPLDTLTGLFDGEVDVEVRTAQGAVRGVVVVRGERATVSLELAGPPLSIRWDRGGWLLHVADFPRPTVMLTHQLAADDDVLGRIEAAELLRERVGEPKARDALALAVASDRAPAVRVRAAGALQTFAADSIARAALLAATRDPDPRVRERAAAALGASRAAVPTDAMPDSGGVETRRPALAAPDPLVVARLRELIDGDSSRYVRGAAVLAHAALDPTEAVPIITRVLERDGWRDIERTHAMYALALIDTPESWQTTLRYLSPATSRATRRAAVQSLAARAKGREAELGGVLVPLLDADDPFLRVAVADALGTVGDRGVIPALVARRAIEADSRVITAIRRALSALGTR